MSRRYRIAYANEALAALSAMKPEQRRRYDAGLATLAAEPYGAGSTPQGHKDRRQAVIADTITLYLVSAGVLTITVVRIVH